jgi:cytochrome P450
MSNGPPRAPSPFGLPASGHAFSFRRDPLGFLQAGAARCGPVARLRIGALVYHLVSDPALIAEVLQARASNYVRDTRSSRNMRLVTGESLLSASGETWRRHRRLAQPVFHQRRLAALADAMVAAVADTTTRWEQASRTSAPLDLASEMSRLTFSIVGRCLFGTELGARAADVEQSFPVLLDELFRRARAIVALPMWLPTPGHVRFRRALATIDHVVAQILASRRRDPTPRDDLLGLLLQARDEDGSALSDAEIRSHVVTFLLAGHETAASTLTWTFCLLHQHPNTRAALEQEIDTTLGGRAPAWENIPLLSHVNEVLHESLRLYPTIWIAERRVVAADTLGGFAIPANSTVVTSAYVTQRLEKFWPEPDVFQPSRFSDPAPPTTLARGYFPFGAGPHQCIGQHFALLEMRIVLAILLARFRVRLLEEFPAPVAGITLRPAEGVPVKIELR